jgi:hypothetical protein
MPSLAESPADAAFAWEMVEQRVAEYLRGEGVPAAVARRLSHAVIRMCADEADSVARGSRQDRALEEARTLLETWQANRCEQAAAAAALADV